MVTNLSPKQLRQAADLKDKIAALETKLAGILGGKASAAPAATGKRKRRKFKMSAAGRARIVAAQKARWAKIKASKSK